MKSLFSDLTDDDDVIETLRSSRKLSRKDALAIRKRIETEKDMQNCFGFDVSTLLIECYGVFSFCLFSTFPF
jgi:hypothetical protein